MRLQLHGSCAARDDDAVLFVGPSGSGKSDMVLRLIGAGFMLVADDQVVILDGMAQAPAALAGLLEIRGLGLTRLAYVPAATLRLVVQLQPGCRPDRLPVPGLDPALRLPLITLDPWAASATQVVLVALDCLAGRVAQIAGAFTPEPPR